MNGAKGRNWFGLFAGVHKSSFCAQIAALSYALVRGLLLPSAFLLISCSEFQTTPHDDAHGAFMTLPPYTRTREGEAPQLGSGPTPCRLGLCVRKYPQPW